MQLLRIQFPPIFLPTLCLIGGILAGAQSADISGTLWIMHYIILVLFGLILNTVCRPIEQAKPRLIQIIFSLGLCAWAFATTHESINAYRVTNTFFSNHCFSFAGTIIGKEQAPFYKKQAIIVSGAAIMRSHFFKPRPPRCQCSIKIFTTDISNLAIGDEIYCPKLFWLPSKDKKKEPYMIREGICASVTTKPEKIYIAQKGSGFINKFSNLCADLKYKTLCALERSLSPSTYSLFCTLFLGASPDYFQEMESVKNNFSNWGIFHYLSRSGLHVVIMIALWQAMVRICMLPYALIQIILMLILALFWLLSWPSASFARSILSFAAIQTTIIQGQQPHGINIVSLICFLLLIVNPFSLFFLNFQLSFLLTWALALYYESVAHST